MRGGSAAAWRAAIQGGAGPVRGPGGAAGMEALLLGAGLLLGAYVLVYYNLVKAPPCGGIASLRGRTAVVTGECRRTCGRPGGGEAGRRGQRPTGLSAATARPPQAPTAASGR